ncbi:Hsp20/alpha crystallin family protein [Magnetofaba australis]|uniref:Putative HSP20 family protein n=1 Tax=Magnetofaba australis IT-1 TaxID=1434232 RepID=A0A1Y2K1A4_9PROT|nr:Hsp20/alpha crystallin family protein [Magnetofaba australis]OSM01830.1 putative HSP20 family protein [Magnetofaba australis IT-1]
MSLISFDPFAELRAFNREFDRAFAANAKRRAEFEAPLDIIENEQAVAILVDLPGVEKEAIQINLEEETLTIAAERKAPELPEKTQMRLNERPWGQFQRAFRLPRGLDAQRIEAEFAHGVLTITIPRAEQAKARAIPVTAH